MGSSRRGYGGWALAVEDVENWTAMILEDLAYLGRQALRARTNDERRELAGLIETRRRRLDELKARRRELLEKGSTDDANR